MWRPGKTAKRKDEVAEFDLIQQHSASITYNIRIHSITSVFLGYVTLVKRQK